MQDPQTGRTYSPTWEAKSNASPSMIKAWNRKQKDDKEDGEAAKQARPTKTVSGKRPVGRPPKAKAAAASEEKPKRGRPAGKAKAKAVAAASKKRGGP